MCRKKGRVILIGAGPGDKGLITVKGLEYLKQADIVVYDRLVSKDILSLSPEKAEFINVGKVMNHHNIPQPEINKILLNKALEGKTVVRLKGGDPFVFGRGGEELELLSENNIEYEVVPGITSAVSALAYAGIPVTHRDFASSIHFVTGHAKDGLVENIDFKALAASKGTILFYMGVSTLSQLINGQVRILGLNPVEHLIESANIIDIELFLIFTFEIRVNIGDGAIAIPFEISYFRIFCHKIVNDTEYVILNLGVSQVEHELVAEIVFVAVGEGYNPVFVLLIKL